MDGMFGYIDEYGETSYAAPLIIDEFSGATADSNHWQFVLKYLQEKKSSFGYWTFNGDVAGTPDVHQYGMLDSTWLNIN